MKKKGLGDRTINNRLVEVGTFLKANGVKDVTLSQEYVEKKVKAYRPDELKTLFAVATPDETIMFQFYLATGAREGEVMHAEWTDIDFVEQIYTVTEKADWKPKDSEEREIPLPDFLVAALKERMLRSN